MLPVIYYADYWYCGRFYQIYQLLDAATIPGRNSIPLVHQNQILFANCDLVVLVAGEERIVVCYSTEHVFDA